MLHLREQERDGDVATAEPAVQARPAQKRNEPDGCNTDEVARTIAEWVNEKEWDEPEDDRNS